MTRDLTTACFFYHSVFGWTAQSTGLRRLGLHGLDAARPAGRRRAQLDECSPEETHAALAGRHRDRRLRRHGASLRRSRRHGAGGTGGSGARPLRAAGGSRGRRLLGRRSARIAAPKGGIRRMQGALRSQSCRPSRSAPRFPGPRSRAWIERKEQVIANAKALWVPVFVERAEGALVTDVDGNTFIDFAGGIGCLAVGHSNAAVTAAVQEQVARFLHTDFTVMPYDSYVELAERLCARLPITGATKAAFFNSGAEAVENAVKIAKAATGRPGRDRLRGRVPRPHAHGDVADLEAAPVQGGLRAVRARGLPRRVPVRVPLAGGRRHRRARSTTCAARSRRASRPRTWPRSSSSRSRARAASCRRPPAYLRGLREICDEHGIVLIADEVQTGFGRTGTPVRDRAVRRRARPRVRRQVDRRRPAALGRARARRDHGRAGRLGDRRHLRRQPRRLRRRARGARRDRPARPLRARARDRRGADAAHARPPGSACRSSATCAGSAR